MDQYLSLYILITGIIITIMGIMEILKPVLAFSLWKRWARHRLFFLHGILLMVGGFPLTIYSGKFSGVIFGIGIMLVLTGPFVLLYPGKFARTFQTASEEMDREGEKKIIYIEAVFRILVGMLFIGSFIL
jgi:uncharacterized protein YjeT (DUF2065 family)